MAKNAEATAEKVEQEAKQQDQEDMVECPRQGITETMITHPLRHLASPGIGNKVEAAFSVAGRVFVLWGGYRYAIKPGYRFVSRLITG